MWWRQTSALETMGGQETSQRSLVEGAPQEEHSNTYPGREDTVIMEGGFRRAGLTHCTPDVLTSATSPTVGNSTA